MARRHVGYVLPEEMASSGAPQVFPEFPGRFVAGEALSLQHLGLEENEADDMISRLGLPLQKTTMSEAEATREIDRGDNFKPSTPGGVPLPADPAKLEELSHEQLDAVAEEAGVPAKGTKAEKAQALAAGGASLDDVEAVAAEGEEG